MAITDLEYMQVMDDARYVANAYGIWPSFGVIQNAPFVCMIFENEENGRKLFEQHFFRWAQEANNGDAVGITFVEWNDGSYAMAIYPEMQHSIERMFPDDVIREELEIISMVAYRAKEFPQKSQFFEQFKAMAQNNAVLIMGGTLEGPFKDLIIRKLRVDFVLEDHIDDHPIARTLFKGREDGEFARETEPPLEPAERILQRRTHNLQKYFPVTLERIRKSSTFQDAMNVLLDSRYQSWQVAQALCNLVLSSNTLGTLHFQNPENDDSDDSISVHALVQDQYLEKPSMNEIPENLFEPAVLRRQIKLDSIELLKGRKIPPPKKTGAKSIQKTLRREGLLAPSDSNSSI